MPRIGITGHTNLTSTSQPLITQSIRKALIKYSRTLIGVTCLARGADQVFARVVLELSGNIEVVLPAADYRERKVKPNNLVEFNELLTRASAVHTMPFAYASREAYMAASEYLLSTVDSIIAVWDGKPTGEFGGTADVVSTARKRRIPVTVVWPAGAQREHLA